MMTSHSIVATHHAPAPAPVACRRSSQSQKRMTQRAALRGNCNLVSTARRSSSSSTRAAPASISAALGDIERARGQDYASAAACFVEAFFLGRKSKAAETITKGELAYLNGAQKKDMVARYTQRGMGTMLVGEVAGSNPGGGYGCTHPGCHIAHMTYQGCPVHSQGLSGWFYTDRTGCRQLHRVLTAK